MKYKFLMLIMATGAFAQAPATYQDARPRLFRLRSPLSDEQRGDVAIVMATSYACGKWDATGTAPNGGSTMLGTAVSKTDCADVLGTIKSAKGTFVK